MTKKDKEIHPIQLSTRACCKYDVRNHGTKGEIHEQLAEWAATTVARTPKYPRFDAQSLARKLKLDSVYAENAVSIHSTISIDLFKRAHSCMQAQEVQYIADSDLHCTTHDMGCVSHDADKDHENEWFREGFVPYKLTLRCLYRKNQMRLFLCHDPRLTDQIFPNIQFISTHLSSQEQAETVGGSGTMGEKLQ